MTEKDTLPGRKYFSTIEYGELYGEDLAPVLKWPFIDSIRGVIKWIHEAVELAGAGYNPFSKKW
ncbi:MAG: hypothetical protein Q7R43_04530 [Candidatus Daviesbacteria bacterium]|nr:hypothetical protein [Candidatus Daviesbacteria bacterium]